MRISRTLLVAAILALGACGDDADGGSALTGSCAFADADSCVDYFDLDAAVAGFACVDVGGAWIANAACSRDGVVGTCHCPVAGASGSAEIHYYAGDPAALAAACAGSDPPCTWTAP
jgi:hypothetical protein